MELPAGAAVMKHLEGRTLNGSSRIHIDPRGHDEYSVALQMTGRLCGGVPRSPDLVRPWLEARTGYSDELTDAQEAGTLAALDLQAQPVHAAATDQVIPLRQAARAPPLRLSTPRPPMPLRLAKPPQPAPLRPTRPSGPAAS
jgi:hypothetical protein